MNRILPHVAPGMSGYQRGPREVRLFAARRATYALGVSDQGVTSAQRVRARGGCSLSVMSAVPVDHQGRGVVLEVVPGRTQDAVGQVAHGLPRVELARLDHGV